MNPVLFLLCVSRIKVKKMPVCLVCKKEANPPVYPPCSHVLCCCCTLPSVCPICNEDFNPDTILLSMPPSTYKWGYSSARKKTWWVYDEGANCSIETAWKDYQAKNMEDEDDEVKETTFEPVDYSKLDRLEQKESIYLLSIGTRKYQLDFETMTQAPLGSPKKTRKIIRFSFPSTEDPVDQLKKQQVLGIAGVYFS